MHPHKLRQPLNRKCMYAEMLLKSDPLPGQTLFSPQERVQCFAHIVPTGVFQTSFFDPAKLLFWRKYEIKSYEQDTIAMDVSTQIFAEVSLVDFASKQSPRWIPMFRRNMLLPSSGFKDQVSI